MTDTGDQPEARQEFTDAQIRQTIVQTREDTMMMVAHLAVISKLLSTIRLLLGLSLAAGLVIAYLVSQHA